VGTKILNAQEVFKETASSIRRRMQEVVRRHGLKDEKLFLSDYYVLSCERLCGASCFLPASFGNRLTKHCCHRADNLCNEAHLDHGDKSRCFSCFVGKYPGQAKRWFSHLPALGPHGTVIRLVSGLILAWRQAGASLHGDVARRFRRGQHAAWLLCGGALRIIIYLLAAASSYINY
jgi:hypothetical protein